MRRLVCCLCCVTLLLSSAAMAGAGGRVLYRVDFSTQPDGDAVAWLTRQGFAFHLRAHELAPRFEQGRLVLETATETAGVFVQTLHVPGVRRLRVRWGVDRHPQGADWAKGVYRVPIAVMVSFGEDKIASGSLFVPNAPYFLSVFLGAHEQEGRAYTARYYQQGGRYFCQPCGVPSGQTVVTEFDLATHFTEQFQQRVLPPVSSVSFQMNTTDTAGGARAFLMYIELLG
jgi:hypothetical protein